MLPHCLLVFLGETRCRGTYFLNSEGEGTSFRTSVVPYHFFVLLRKHTAYVSFTLKSALQLILGGKHCFFGGFFHFLPKERPAEAFLSFMPFDTRVVSCLDLLVLILHHIPVVHKFLSFSLPNISDVPHYMPCVLGMVLLGVANLCFALRVAHTRGWLTFCI